MAGRTVTAVCDGGDVSSDVGVLLFAQADAKLDLTTYLSAGLRDVWQAGKVEHPALEQLQARVFGIARGYEDANDVDHLESDPGFKVACDRLPSTGSDLAY